MSRPKKYPSDINSGTKKCTKCHCVRQISEYYKSKNSSDGLFYNCIPCYKESYSKKATKQFQKEKWARHKYLKLVGKDFNIPNFKICSTCNLEKALVNFSKNKISKDGHLAFCKDCAKERNKKWRKNNTRDKIVVKKNVLKRNYNLSWESYIGMLSAQEGNCKICSQNMFETKQGPCVDHNHSTGKVRGLLCSYCNKGLGYFKDNENYLISAENYLKENRE